MEGVLYCPKPRLVRHIGSTVVAGSWLLSPLDFPCGALSWDLGNLVLLWRLEPSELRFGSQRGHRCLEEVVEGQGF